MKQGLVNVEYFRDIQPILRRSCITCHTAKHHRQSAGNLDLDADTEQVVSETEGTFPGTYYRLAIDEKGRFGHKPVGWDSWGWGYPNASRYVRKFQSRRSLLVWKIFGERLDGFANDDHPSEAKPGFYNTLTQRGREVDLSQNRHRYDLDYSGTSMPPPEAVRAGKAVPLSDDDRRTLAAWIDLGCPIDLDFDPLHPRRRGLGWMLDDNRPIVTLAIPQPGVVPVLDRILVGFHDYDTGLDPTSLIVAADFAIDGVPAGRNLAARFRPRSTGVWELKFDQPIRTLDQGTLWISVRDWQGNTSRLNRRFSIVTRPRPDG